ncbi:MAG: polysaccharide deacetylase family protein [Acidobacteriota bacterium]
MSALAQGIGVGVAASLGAIAAAASGAGPFALGAVAAATGLTHAALWRLRPTKTPVVMLHSVVGDRAGRPGAFSLWCPPAMFEAYLQYLKRRRYHTITLTELHQHLEHGTALPSKPIVLTFDDGYLDNWVYAAPLLKKYGFTGTVFVPSDFVAPEERVRPTIEDVWAGKLSESDLDVYGYMNRAELRAVAQQGVLDVQSHGRTHTWLPYSESVIEFHHPDLKLRHLRPTWWNAFPERKPYWFQRISVDDLPWGAPVYENRLALAAPAVQPDPGLSAHLIAFTAEHGGREFFLRPDWRQQLQRQVDVYRSEAPPSAKPESQEEFRARLRWELEGSRLALEAITGKPVRFMCWPNGGTCEQAFELLNECGYWAATLPSRAKQPNNNIGTRPDRIGRISATSFFRGTTTPLPWVVSFALKVERNRGNHYMELPIKAIWLYRKFVKPGGVTPPGAEE